MRRHPLGVRQLRVVRELAATERNRDGGDQAPFEDAGQRSSPPRAFSESIAARCAGAVGKYWPYHDRLFERQPAFRRADLLLYADELGLDREAFTRCLDERRFAADVDRDVAQAQALGFNSTPTFLVNGRRVVGAISVEEFRTIVDDALRTPR